MSGGRDIFGVYLPRRSPVHALPAGVKIVALTVVMLVAFWLRTVPVTVGLLVACVALLALARLPLRQVLWPGWMALLLLALLVAYHLLAGSPRDAIIAAATLLIAVLAGRLIVCTTPVPAVMDAVARGLRPLRWVGIDPDRIALAMGVMLRSIPMLMVLFEEVGQAAAARGLDRNPLARVTPVVIRSVSYAQRTGDALAARGLGERQSPLR